MSDVYKVRSPEISTILIHPSNKIQTFTPLSVLPEVAAIWLDSYVRK
jgi:hypothetical protein